MKYTIICKDQEVFYSDRYDAENYWCDKLLCVIDNINKKVTFDGVTWKEVDIDHL